MENKEFIDFWCEKLGFCGCGCPEDTAKYLLSLLNILNFDNDYEKKMELLGEDNEPRSYLILYLLDKAGWTEHGGSVGGCWLSDEGKKVRKSLEELTKDI